MNPELRRNLWLEFSTQRLLATPLILGVAFAIPVASDGFGGGEVSNAAIAIGFLLLLVWGCRLAGDAVAGEVAARTWDSQRLTPVGAWSMASGKLFGSTAFVWYGGAFCLLGIALDNPDRLAPDELAKYLIIVVMAVLLGQAVAMLLGLQVLRGRRAGVMLRSTIAQLGGIAVATLPLIFNEAWYPAGDTNEQVRWYGYLFISQEFLLLSVALFLGFALIGLHHLMRLELQLLNLPVAWVLFVLAAMGWIGGIANELARGTDFPVWAAQMLVFAVAAALTYITAFTEPKDIVVLSRLRAALGAGRLRLALCLMPRWAITFALATMMAGFLLIQGPVDDFMHNDQPLAAGKLLDSHTHMAAVLSALLYLARDTLILFALGLGIGIRRGEAAAVIYLLTLWVLLPGATSAIAGSKLANVLFLPAPQIGLIGLISPAVQTLLALGLALYAWRRAARGRG